MHGGALGLLGCRVDHDRRLVDGRNQLAQFLDGIVKRISDGARDVLGNGRFHGQVTVCEATHFVQQPQNCLLISFVLFTLVPRLALESRHANVQENQRDHQDNRKPDQPDRNPGAR